MMEIKENKASKQLLDPMKKISVEEIDTRINVLSQFYLKSYQTEPYQRSISLYNGRSGSTLVQALIYEATGNEAIRKEMEINIDFLVDKLQTGPDFYPDHCNGISGLGWLFMFLNDKGFMDYDREDFFEDLDEILDSSLENLLLEKNFDLLHGAMGIGMYFLKRGKFEPVRKIVQALYEDAEIDSEETKWSRFDKHKLKCDLYDLGLAHGNAGILYFLLKAFKSGILPDKCKELIDGSIEFFMRNTQSHDENGSYFPSSILKHQYRTSEDIPHLSRLAWCYGDLGMLYTIYTAALFFNKKITVQQTLLMLEQTAKRMLPESTLLVDAGFCHGASGAGYMFSMLYKLSGGTVFKEASDHWLRFVIDQGMYEDKTTAGYLFDTGEQGWKPLTSFLSGVGGVQAFLLSIRYPELPDDWNECLFIS